MRESIFLENHEQGLGRLLGIRFAESTRQRVVTEVTLTPSHLTEVDTVQGGVLVALADLAGAFGALLNAPEGMINTTIESKTNFLRPGRGSLLWAEAEPIHVGRRTSVWRSRVYRGAARGEGRPIAEVVQTELFVPAGPGEG
jgi:1,4-dihydroxy-2-naphthoyl-CoA hydrolase